jgi:hypothetical protein
MADLSQSGQKLSLVVTGDEYLPARAGRSSGIEVTVTVCGTVSGKKRAANSRMEDAHVRFVQEDAAGRLLLVHPHHLAYDGKVRRQRSDLSPSCWPHAIGVERTRVYLTEHKLRFKEVGASSSSSSSSSLSSRCEPSLRGYGLASSAAAAPSAPLPSTVAVARVRDTLHASSFTAWGVMHSELGFQQHDAQCWALPVLSRSNAVFVRIHRARCGMWLLLGETAPTVCIDLMQRRWLRPDGRVISTDGQIKKGKN